MHSQNNKSRQQHCNCVALDDCVRAESLARRSGGSILPLFDGNIAEKITRRLTRRANLALPIIKY